MDDQNKPESPWAWVPVVPRNLIVVSWLVFIAVAVYAVWDESVANPGQAWRTTLWQGIGGNASGVYYWLLMGTYLTSEVILMLLTLRKNQDDLEKATAKARAEAKAAAEAAAAQLVEEAATETRRQTRQEVQQAWEAWYETVQEDLANGRPPQTPPPSNINAPY